MIVGFDPIIAEEPRVMILGVHAQRDLIGTPAVLRLSPQSLLADPVCVFFDADRYI